MKNKMFFNKVFVYSLIVMFILLIIDIVFINSVNYVMLGLEGLACSSFIVASVIRYLPYSKK